MMKTKTRTRAVRGGREVESRLAHGPGEPVRTRRRAIEIDLEICGEPRLRARRERIKRIRREIEEGTYLTEARLNYAMEKMIEGLANELANPARD